MPGKARDLSYNATKKMLTYVGIMKSKWDLVEPKIETVGGFPFIDAQDKANPPTFKYAIIELKILNFDLNSPPLLKIFDEQTNQLLETIKFVASPTSNQLLNLKVPIFLSHDTDPWSNVDKEPKACITRIELHMPVLNYVQVVYAKLKEGIFVVPVYWHNVADKSKNWKAFVDNMDVIDLFWRAPPGADFYCVNSIWAQAGIQFRLVNTSVPFILASIPTHYLQAPDTSHASDCDPTWTPDLSSPKGVDIYAIYDLKADNDPDADGCGNCWANGHILIRAGDPKQSDPGFTDKLMTIEGRAILVAHEFGHYLGILGHQDNVYDNLMNRQLSGAVLEKFQIDQTRQQIKCRRYNEKNNP
jgi:hypothetical protein